MADQGKLKKYSRAQARLLHRSHQRGRLSELKELRFRQRSRPVARTNCLRGDGLENQRFALSVPDLLNECQ
jgi:uncharacterized protein YjhX (UPF0386 family)